MSKGDEQQDSVEFDARKLHVNELNETLSSTASSIESIKIRNCNAPDHLAPGFDRNCQMSINGDLGDYCLCCVANAEIEIQGRAGCGLGQAMESGSIILHHDAGDAAGAFNRGGMIAIYGNTGRRTACGMCGGDVVVKGSIGTQGAYGMTEGTLLVLGKAGVMLGEGMTGGTIYLAGEVESMASQLEMVRLRESDRLRISLLLLKAGLQGEARNFRVLKVSGT